MQQGLEFLDGQQLTVYSSNGCPDCTRLDQWMQRHEIAFEKVWIDQTPGAADKLERETGKQAVPFILVNGSTWVRGYHNEEASRLSEHKLLNELREALG